MSRFVRRWALVVALVVAGSAWSLALTAPAGAQEEEEPFDPICGLQGVSNCEPPSSPPSSSAPPDAPPVEEPPVEEPPPDRPEDVEPPPENPDEPPADEGEDGVEVEDEEALLIAGGLILLLLGGGNVTSLFAKPATAPPPGSVTRTDAEGEPLVVHDGTYRGGRRGDVWWIDRWVTPAEAARLIDEQRAVLERADQYRHEKTPQSRDDRLLPAEIAGREAAAASREARRRRAADYYRAERAAAEGAEVAEVELESAAGFERTRQRWEWGGWFMDRGVDGLAGVTGPVGGTIKKVYKVTKPTAEGMTEDFRADERDAFRLGHNTARGLGRGIGDVVFDDVTDRATKLVGGKARHLADRVRRPDPAASTTRAMRALTPDNLRNATRRMNVPVAPDKVNVGHWTTSDLVKNLRGGGGDVQQAIASKSVRTMAEDVAKGRVKARIKDPYKKALGIKRDLP